MYSKPPITDFTAFHTSRVPLLRRWRQNDLENPPEKVKKTRILLGPPKVKKSRVKKTVKAQGDIALAVKLTEKFNLSPEIKAMIEAAMKK